MTKAQKIEKRRAQNRTAQRNLRSTKKLTTMMRSVQAMPVATTGLTAGDLRIAITTAANEAAERIADRLQGGKQAPSDMTASDVDRFHGEGGKVSCDHPQQAQPAGVMTVLISRLDNAVCRARSIRDRQGDALVGSFGRREIIPAEPTNAKNEAGVAGAPAKADIIGMYLRNLESALTELDAQSRLIIEALD